MSNYSQPITATGSLISFNAHRGGLIDSLSVPITPTQNLNGYSKPWAGGAGKNLLQITGRIAVTTGKILNTNPRDFSAPYAYIGITMNNYFNNERIASYSITDKSVSLTSKQKGYGIGLNVGVSPETTYTFSYKNKTSTFAGVGYYDIDGNYLSYKQFLTGTWSFTTPANCVNLMVVLLPNANIDTLYDEPQLELGSLESSWVPYENICPISGSTGLSVYVSPTQDQQDATPYSVDWTAEAGTVYGGSYEAVSGELKTRPHYVSYNGETLVGPWMSSMDEYAAGTTPTTGAEVVDLGGSETTYQLTAQTIQMLVGQNYLWVSTSAVLTLVYRLLNAPRITGSTSIGKNAESLTVTPQFNGISKVVINVTEQLFYEAGNDTGRTITIDCPWGTQAMANNLLSLLQGYQFQPYEASNALLDPAAELGDGLTVNGVYGGIFKMTVRSGALHAVDVSAPQDEEIDHEYPFASSSERKIERQLANVKSELSVQADQISAKVDREGGDPSSVSWEMNADQFKILSDGSEVLVIDDNGLTVNGDGNFTGEVHAGNIKYGGSSGSFSGRGISGGSLAAGKFTQGVNDQLANADYSADVFSGGTIANYMKAKNIYVTGENAFYVYGSKISRKYLKVTDANGNAANLYYLYWEP